MVLLRELVFGNRRRKQSPFTWMFLFGCQLLNLVRVLLLLVGVLFLQLQQRLVFRLLRKTTTSFYAI